MTHIMHDACIYIGRRFCSSLWRDAHNAPLAIDTVCMANGSVTEVGEAGKWSEGTATTFLAAAWAESPAMDFKPVPGHR